MAAKLGARVAMVTKLGRDVFGDGTVANFREWGVDAEHVLFTDDAASGVAPIAVDPDGNNSIIIVTGANDLLTEQEIERARGAIASAAVVVSVGARGCLVVDAEGARRVPVEPVEAVDTTGAGDAFVGSLACFLAQRRSLVEAAERANRIAAVSVRGRGTQTSFPAAADLP